MNPIEKQNQINLSARNPLWIVWALLTEAVLIPFLIVLWLYAEWLHVTHWISSEWLDDRRRKISEDKEMLERRYKIDS